MRCVTCVCLILSRIVRSVLDVFIIFPETVPEVSRALEHEVVDGLQRLEDSMGRGSLQPFSQVIHQVPTVV